MSSGHDDLVSCFAFISAEANSFYGAWTAMALGVRSPNLLSRLCCPGSSDLLQMTCLLSVPMSSFVRLDVGSYGPFQTLRLTDSIHGKSQLQGDFQKLLSVTSAETKGDVSFGFILCTFPCFWAPFGRLLLKALPPALPYVESPWKKNTYLRNLST